jgi:hypothetical protein
MGMADCVLIADFSFSAKLVKLKNHQVWVHFHRIWMGFDFYLKINRKWFGGRGSDSI